MTQPTSLARALGSALVQASRATAGYEQDRVRDVAAAKRKATSALLKSLNAHGASFVNLYPNSKISLQVMVDDFKKFLAAMKKLGYTQQEKNASGRTWYFSGKEPKFYAEMTVAGDWEVSPRLVVPYRSVAPQEVIDMLKTRGFTVKVGDTFVSAANGKLYVSLNAEDGHEIRVSTDDDAVTRLGETTVSEFTTSNVWNFVSKFM